MKYDLRQMLKEIKEDEKVFQKKTNYWASQKEINQMVKDMKHKKTRNKAGK
ncbi:MAG: hypothetical protein R6V39_02245 [Desulfovibrionales bacterium]